MDSVPVGHDRKEAVLMRWNNAIKYCPKTGQHDGFWMRISKAVLTPFLTNGCWPTFRWKRECLRSGDRRAVEGRIHGKESVLPYQTRYAARRGPPRGIASPTLANMVLDGLEQLVRSCSTFKDHGKGRKSTVDRINLVRYCDDFIVTAKSRVSQHKR